MIWGQSYLPAVVNDAAMNMGVQISVPVPDFNPFVYILRRVIAGQMMILFNF